MIANDLPGFDFGLGETADLLLKPALTADETRAYKKLRAALLALP